MNKRILLIFAPLLLLSTNYAQLNPGARQISLSNSDVALSNDVFSIFNNPAGLSQLNWREIGVYYSPESYIQLSINRYILHTLKTNS